MRIRGRFSSLLIAGALAMATVSWGCSSSTAPVPGPSPQPPLVGGQVPAGAFLFSFQYNVFEGCQFSGGQDVCNYNYDYWGTTCNSSSSCANPAGDQVVYAQNSSCSMPGNEDQYPVTAVAGNAIGVIFGGKKDPFIGSSSGVASYVSANNAGNPVNNSFDSPITALTPPLNNGNFFVGMESGRMDLCSIYNTNCTAPFNSLGDEITAMALDPVNYVVWAGTSGGGLLACSLTRANGCATLDNLAHPITNIVPYNGKVGVLTNQGVLLSCPYPAANSCETLLSDVSSYLGVAHANGSLYLLDRDNDLYRYPLPFDAYNYMQVTSGWNRLAAEGTSVYGLCGNGLLDICTCDDENSCSTFSQLETGIPGSGGWEVNAIGVLSSLPPMPPTPPPPMSLPQTVFNATAPSGGQCSFTVPVKYAADTVTVDGVQPSGSCVGAQTSCSLDLSGVEEGTVLQENVTDGTTTVPITVSCTLFPTPMQVAPTSFGQTSFLDPCEFGTVSVSNANGPVTLTGVDATLSNSTCSGPAASCSFDLSAGPPTGGQGVLSDGFTSVNILVQCSLPSS
jgi:hypothetical protein